MAGAPSACSFASCRAAVVGPLVGMIDAWYLGTIPEERGADAASVGGGLPMTRGRATAGIVTILTLLLGTTPTAAREGGVVEGILETHPEWFADVLARADEHRLQILYTQIDRDVENRPSFRSHGYRLAPDRYFYPASTVKLPAAALALEKLNELRFKQFVKELAHRDSLRRGDAIDGLRGLGMAKAHAPLLEAAPRRAVRQARLRHGVPEDPLGRQAVQHRLQRS